VVSKPEHVQAIFYDSHLHFKALNNDSGYFFGEILGRCVGLLSGKHWKGLRQEMDVAFNHKAILDSTTSISKATNNFIDDLMSSTACQNGILDPADDMMYFFFFTTAELMYGPLSSHQKIQLKKISVVRNKLFTYVLEGGIHRFSASKWVPSQANRDLAAFQKLWREWNEEMYELSRKTAKTTSFSEWWRQSLDGEIDMVQVSPHIDPFYVSSINPNQLLQTLDESLFANLDVTTGAVSWALLFLAAYPEEQDTLLNEVNKSFFEGEQMWADYVTRNDTFLAACLNEAARLRPGLRKLK
jgi:gliotoxin/aspirochlorine/mycotoxins biosynthesis cytochrome P450 monooxygenase